jgi:hypothetical protein
MFSSYISEYCSRVYKKLIIGTHHDSIRVGFFDVYNPHKILGFAALGHFIYRYFCYVKYGSMFFTRTIYDLPFIAGHLLLSCSSFLFPVSKKRNYENQIIWRELQLHNIVFTARSCLIFTYDIFYPEQNIWSRFAIVMACHFAADLVTDYYKDGTTMRDMAQDNILIPNWTKVYFDRFYAFSQFSATTVLILPTSHVLEYALMIMFAIQISTFLMTLRLKGLINNDAWHVVYSAALLTTYHIAFTGSNKPQYIYSVLLPFYIWRIHIRGNKYLGWALMILIYDFFIYSRLSSPP